MTGKLCPERSAIRWNRPSEPWLRAFLRDGEDRPFTYPEVGATRAMTLPAGYRNDRIAAVVGHGDEAWVTACEGVRTWQAHRRAGVAVSPQDAPVEEGVAVALTVRLASLAVVARCRIAYVTDEEERFGFAYGTLPGHPERGEEAFHVARAPDGSVRFEIVAFSRPAAMPARLVGPVTRLVQARITDRYLDGMRDHVAHR